MGDLWSKTNYITDQEYICNRYIYEYDIRAANVSVLRAYGKIDNDQYARYLSMPKELREYNIGMLIRLEKEGTNKSETYDIIKTGIAEAKHQLFLVNGIQDDQIIRIASDAVYVSGILNKILDHTVINIFDGFVEFKVKGPWNTMLKLPSNVIVFLGYLQNGNFDVDVKGISNDLLKLHEPFLGMICELISCMETYTLKDTLHIFKDYYDKYINKELPIGYYREFNSGSSFRLMNSDIGARFLDQKYMDYVDISHNNYVLRTIYRIITSYMK